MRAGTRWLLIATHVPLLVTPTLLVTLTGVPSTVPGPWAGALTAVAFSALVCLLQLRHSLAAARGVRPRGWPWTLAALAVAVLLPLLWLQSNWSVTVWALGASTLMLLPAPLSVVATVALMVATTVHGGFVEAELYELDAAGNATNAFYTLLVLVVGVGGLVGAVRLARLADELAGARAELAELAVQGERLRVSRDLHDLLGQSLSAVSLKGDLAMRLWPRDRAAALVEVEGLTELARGALRDVRAVTFDAHAVSLRAELAGAQSLLAAAGVDVRVDVPPGCLDGPADAALGWALREGVTNILRHSAATEATITAAGRSLEIVNDGAGHPGPGGGGLAGIAERIEPAGGVVEAGPLPGGRFRLAVRIPEVPR